MAVQEYRQKTSLKSDSVTNLEISEELINVNLSKLPKDRKGLARRQIDSLKERINYHPRLRAIYLQEIYKIIQYELESKRKELSDK